ncbi:hypothetical protein LZ554_008899 [Drepanopeziza brunnea f. sp. 'monogermtubi']|nr:hypothetical protein LZ554_008899 [Drepanopeziza brunnea f. sp. 'monogermtubi']
MQRRYSSDSEQLQPFHDSYSTTPPSPVDCSRFPSTTSPRHSPVFPSAHPDSSFDRLRAARRYSRERGHNPNPNSSLRDSCQSASASRERFSLSSPPHRDEEGRVWGQELGYSKSHRSNITTGADSIGEGAAGGIAGIAMGVIGGNSSESGWEARRDMPGHHDPRMDMHDGPSGYDGVYEHSPYSRPPPPLGHSQSSLTPLGAAAFPPGLASPQARSTISRSDHSIISQPYLDNPNPYQQRFSRNIDPSMGEIDPSTIDDDGDDGLDYRNRSNISLGHDSSRAAPAVAGAGVLGALGLGKKGMASSSGTEYDTVKNSYGGANNFDLGQGLEKSAWLAKDAKAKQKRRCWTLAVIIAVVGCAIVGGIVGGILGNQNNGAGEPSPQRSGASASQDTANNGDLTKDSPEIKKLLGNPNLHMVFPGIDYTPMNTQYPYCMHDPASQNNITRDVAVMSQLTNRIRLYGTDCNQTEMVVHAINQLGLNDSMKVWMGVWQDKNATTNARQLAQMYDIFDKVGSEPFVGIVVGNEVLYREDMTLDELKTVLSGVKSNLTAKGIDLPLSSSDLGDDWTQGLADIVDYVMANIHPFFAGVNAEIASGWTWDFWQNHNVVLKNDTTKHIISETGWPSAGGTNCGGATTCVSGSVAGVTEMNEFMSKWVCQALGNGTNYFWFSAFDEPWKISYNEPGKEWEDKWGLMDVNRNLKPGIQIPDCGGRTIS